MSDRVITERELNRALLVRQLLLQRSSLSIPRALEQIGGIQNQYAPNAYIRLHACLDRFERSDLTGALEGRTVIQGTLMRSTIHVVSSRDYWELAAGVQRAGQEWSLKLQKGAVTAGEMEKQAAVVRAALMKGSLRAPDLKRLASRDVVHWVQMIRVPPSGTWDRRRADLYGLAEAWLERRTIPEQHGLECLVRRYLGGFGPAALREIASWAGVPAAMLLPVVEQLTLRRFRDERGAELLDLPGAPLPDADTPAPPRFLPAWDAALLVHARRTGILPEDYRKLVFNTKTPQSISTFLIDGRVAGAWKYENGRILIEPFAQISRSWRKQLDEEKERLLSLYV